MKKNKNTPHDQRAAFERALKKAEAEPYLLRLYVTGTTPKSIQAITNIKRICEAYLKGRYVLEVIDVYQQPVLARGEQIIAAPTLIKRLPLPLRRMIGTMADEQRILLGLDLRPAVGRRRKDAGTRGRGEEEGRGDAGTRRRGEEEGRGDAGRKKDAGTRRRGDAERQEGEERD